MMTTTTAPTLESLFDELTLLEERINKGAAILVQPQHWGKDDEKTLRYESAWIALSAEHREKYAVFVELWKTSGARLDFEFPADAPVALPAGWTRSEDGTLCASLTYEEYCICQDAVRE